MVAGMDDDELLEKYNLMRLCENTSRKPNKWDWRHHNDRTTPIYWFTQITKYILNSLAGKDVQIKCKYISVLFRLILQYSFILEQRNFRKFKAVTIQKAYDLREDADCTDECRQTLGLFLNVIDVQN